MVHSFKGSPSAHLEDARRALAAGRLTQAATCACRALEKDPSLSKSEAYPLIDEPLDNLERVALALSDSLSELDVEEAQRKELLLEFALAELLDRPLFHLAGALEPLLEGALFIEPELNQADPEERALLLAQKVGLRTSARHRREVAKDLGYDIAVIRSGGSECNLCLPYIGKLFSISGKRGILPPLPELPLHAGCPTTFDILTQTALEADLKATGLSKATYLHQNRFITGSPT